MHKEEICYQAQECGEVSASPPLTMTYDTNSGASVEGTTSKCTYQADSNLGTLLTDKLR